AADPGYPYIARAEYERAEKEERDKEREFLERGEKLAQAMWIFGEKAYLARSATEYSLTGELFCGSSTVLFERNSVRMVASGDWSVTKSELFGANCYICTAGREVLFISKHPDGADCLYVEDFPNIAGREWWHWKPRAEVNGLVRQAIAFSVRHDGKGADATS